MNSIEKLIEIGLKKALEKNGVGYAERVMRAVDTLVTEVCGSGTAGDLFFQKNLAFIEGCAPTTLDERGAQVDQLLHAMLALDKNSTFKVGLDGFGQHAGGLIVLDTENDYDHLLVTKGDIYHSGKIGLLGGQGKDVDRGDDLSAALREQGEEIGRFPFDPVRLVPLITTTEWRTSDSRMEGYWIKSSFFVYLATAAEVAAMHEGYKLHVARTGGDPEVHSLTVFPRRQVLDLLRDGRMGYFDQTQAIVRIALCIPLLFKAWKMLEAAGFENPSPKTVWQQAVLLSQDSFDQLTCHSDWREQLDIDSFFAG